MEIAGKNLCRKLGEEPGDDSVSDRCAVNVAPLQLGEEVRVRHRSARILVSAQNLGSFQSAKPPEPTTQWRLPSRDTGNAYDREAATAN
jgi:hypothetical protein